ncbi:MAG: long-chain fatty acid--CoA ligase [Burkholderiales bacterium]
MSATLPPPAMAGLMMDQPLLLSHFIEHAALNHGDVEVVAREIEGDLHRYTYRDAERRMKRLARALLARGIAPGTPLGSLAWNTHRHFELFYGIPGMQAVLHTINPRLFAEQLVYIINHAQDRMLFVDALTLPIVESIADRIPTVQEIVVLAAPERMPATRLHNVLCYETLLQEQAQSEPDEAAWEWPVFDERSASTICFTSGTTGNPKGVVYSHRAAYLQTLLAASFEFFPGHAAGQLEVMMPMAPLFHGNAWNMPFAAPYTGSKLVLPGRNYEPDQLYQLFDEEKVTITAGVPSFWLILMDWMQRNGKALPHLRQTLSSGTAPPRSMIETLGRDYGVDYTQAWGMTEALMGSSAAQQPGTDHLSFEDRVTRRMVSGRAVVGVKMKVVDDEGRTLPRDGESVGHLRVKGPWIASEYLKLGPGSATDDEGWLITGDMAVIDPHGHLTLTDRSKDVLTSGGEWISSVQLENTAQGHPAVLQAAVVAIAHPKWQERPLMLIVRKQGAELTAQEMLDYLSDKVAKWWLPDAVEFVDSLPMTATGKVHKLTLRERYKAYIPLA